MTQSELQPKPGLHFDPFYFVEPCEPDCTPERHAYHQGQWDMAIRINEYHGFRGYPGAVTEGIDMAAINPDANSSVANPPSSLKKEGNHE